MRVPDSSVSLRPLGLGEILDRAVNLCVRFFVPLISIYVWYAIPLAFITFFSSQSLTRIITVFTDAAKSGHPMTADQLAAAGQSQPSDILWGLSAGFFALFVAPLPTAALIEATTAFYLGRTSSVKQAYRVALDRYWNMLGTTLLFGLAAGVIYVVFAIVAFVLVFAGAILYSLSQPLTIVLGVILGVVFTIVLLAIVVVYIFALQLAYFSCVVERANAAVSFSRSVKRAFTGVGLKRTLLVGLIYLAIGIGIGIVALAGEGVVVGLLHSPVLGAIYQTIVRLATAAFTTAFIGVFYLDLRVREEGLDLQLATERAEPQSILPT